MNQAKCFRCEEPNIQNRIYSIKLTKLNHPTNPTKPNIEEKLRIRPKLYNDFYDTINKNMSDSNVGGRRARNIRDNLFIVNGIINFARKENLEVDINLYIIAVL